MVHLKIKIFKNAEIAKMIAVMARESAELTSHSKELYIKYSDL